MKFSKIEILVSNIINYDLEYIRKTGYFSDEKKKIKTYKKPNTLRALPASSSEETGQVK